MSRLQAVNPETATGKAKDLLDGVQKKFGFTPNLMRTFANSPAVLQAYLGFMQSLSGGVLSAKLREQIALTVGEVNDCQYCLAAHTAVGKMVGLSDEEVTDSRRGVSPDRQTEAALQFARHVVNKQGFVSDEDLSSARDAGYNDAEIAEIVANVAQNIFSNYFNHVAQIEVDFPQVESLDNKPVCACG